MSKAILALAVGAAMLAGSLSANAAPIDLKISVPSVPSDIHTQALKMFKTDLEKAAPGQFNVEIYDSGSLFKQGADTDAVERGNLQMTYLSFQLIADQLPQYGLLTMPYLFRSAQHYDDFMKSKLGDQFKADVEQAMNIRLLAPCYLGTRELNLRKQMKVDTPDDLKGVKMRMPDSDAWLFMGKALGANPVPMPFGDVYLGLQTGTIDAQDNPLPTDYAAKFYEVTKQITMTKHLVDAINLVIGADVWNKLDDSQKAAVQNAADAACKWNDTKRKAEEDKLVDFFKSKGLAVTNPDISAFREHVQKYYLDSDRSKQWTSGWVDQINAMAPKADASKKN
ncbi:DctP family TRAP transporter solute-binding subunit [Jiella sp. MQZ9-1]|uniref:DctP family TRAP transporter solute-binding subunit n=1 Tax=Jiella flava TaxID=2816857 RepID=A0A939JX78_9HYPH|nr:DctP family TRAP transporter solute-binding subunit [Jiella flava]MBO0663081.1 DctP family TRAP transporter solute-binding subunit [Jiella flava]MCD2471500.1 DctP family TRAP transporter solute-binding subunit [Jiella flava]